MLQRKAREGGRGECWDGNGETHFYTEGSGKAPLEAGIGVRAERGEGVRDVGVQARAPRGPGVGGDWPV